MMISSMCYVFPRTCGVPGSNGAPNSFALVANTMIAPERIRGATSGKVTVRAVRRRPAPIVRTLFSSRCQHGCAGADQERVDVRLADDPIGEERFMVSEPPGGARAEFAQHPEAADDAREDQKQHDPPITAAAMKSPPTPV
jgi:hypothetical protein